MSIYTDEFDALNSLIGALGSDSISAGNSYELAKIQQLQKVAGIFKLSAIATGQSIKTDSLGNFVPANFAESIHAHSHLDSLVVGAKPANTFLAAPSDTLGEPTYRQIAIADIPGEISSLAGATYAPVSHSHSSLDSLVGNKPAKTFLAAPTDTLGNPSYREIIMADLPGQLSSLQGGSFAPTAHSHAIADLPSLVGASVASNAQKLFWASPNSATGTPSFRAIADSDLSANIPKLNTSNTFTKAQRSQIVTLSIATGVVNLNPADSNDFVLELSQSATLVIAAGVESDSFRLTVIQTAIGGRILTLPVGLKMQGGISATYSTAPGAIDKLYFDTHNGSTWCCSFANFG